MKRSWPYRPQTLTVRLFEVVPGVLFCRLDERQAVGIVPFAIHDQMRVIRHQTVRHDYETSFTCGAQKLLNDQLNRGALLQQQSTSFRCEFEGIRKLFNVREVWQVLRIEMWHAHRLGTSLARTARFRLKSETTGSEELIAERPAAIDEPLDEPRERVNRGSTLIAAASAVIPPEGGNYRTEGIPPEGGNYRTEGIPPEGGNYKICERERDAPSAIL